MTLPPETENMTLEELRRFVILQRYHAWRGSLKGLAANLGIHVTTLYDRLYKYGVFKSRKGKVVTRFRSPKKL